MKEISLQDLLNLADAPAHDGICDFWNQKTIHYLVVFTSSQDDFEIIGVGPTLPCATLEDAGRHVIPGKSPELYVKCPAAVIKRLQPKLPAAGMTQSMPSIKGRTSVPFIRPESPAPPPVAAPAPPPTVSRATASGLKLESSRPKSAAPAPVPAVQLEAQSPPLSALEARERALADREQAFALRERQAKAFLDQAELKQATLAELAEQLRQQDAYLAQNEEKLLAKMHAHQERAAEVDQIGEELRHKSHEIRDAEKKLQARQAELDVLNATLQARAVELDTRAAALQEQETSLKEREAFVTDAENRLIEQSTLLVEKQESLAHKTEEHDKKHGPRASSNTRPALKPVVA